MAIMQISKKVDAFPLKCRKRNELHSRCKIIRDELSQYYSNEGSVPWKTEIVNNTGRTKTNWCS